MLRELWVKFTKSGVGKFLMLGDNWTKYQEDQARQQDEAAGINPDDLANPVNLASPLDRKS